jgi:hypothetical protein
MQVQVRAFPDEVDESVLNRITGDVTAALQSVRTAGDQFIVNDTIWYGFNGKKIMPRVVNTADFISRTFERFLKEQRGWERQKTLEGQTIDAYIELPIGPGYTIDQALLFQFLKEYTDAHPDESPDTATVRLFQMYVRRSCFRIGALEEEYRHFFQPASGTGPLRIGLEFETGNIASSFRSLNKLGFLYRRGHIDAGVFITSRDKATAAARIWPVSNRNGSFEELTRRNYRDAVFFPIWEVGFAPDGFDPTVAYLGLQGSTYVLQNSGKTEVYDGILYEVWKGGEKTVLRRTQPST